MMTELRKLAKDMRDKTFRMLEFPDLIANYELTEEDKKKLDEIYLLISKAKTNLEKILPWLR